MYTIIIADFYIDGKAVPPTPCRAGFENSPCTTYIRKVFNYYYISIPMYVIDSLISKVVIWNVYFFILHDLEFIVYLLRAF